MATRRHRVPQHDNRRPIFTVMHTELEAKCQSDIVEKRTRHEIVANGEEAADEDIHSAMACCQQLPELPLGQPTYLSESNH